MHLKFQDYMILLRDEKEVINDAAVSNLMDFARKKLLSFADPSWITHSPHLFKSLKSALERIALRRQNTGTSQPAAPSLRSTFTPLVPPSALPNTSPLPAQRVVPSPSQQSLHLSQPATPHSATPPNALPHIATTSELRVVTGSAAPVCGSVRTARFPLIACCAEASHYNTLHSVKGRTTVNTDQPYRSITHICGKGWVTAYNWKSR